VWQGTETNSTKSHKRRPNTRMEPTRLWLVKPISSFVTLGLNPIAARFLKNLAPGVEFSE
jgi:hypothetical protein